MRPTATLALIGDRNQLPSPGPVLPRALRPVMTEALRPYLEAALGGDAVGAMDAIDALRVLCVVREGPLGVRAVGDLVERWMAESDERLDPGEEWYVGWPVLVTRNDDDLGVMNGDVGVTLNRDGRAVVAFRPADGKAGEVREAREGTTVVSSRERLVQAASRPVRRATGPAARLWP